MYWRVKLCEANDAFRGGRLDEAGRLLCESGLRDFRPAKQLLAQVIECRVSEAEESLAAGEPGIALARLDELDRRHTETSRVRVVREAAMHVAAAQRFARRGDFARADDEWGRAAALLPHVKALEDAGRACKVKAAASRELIVRLHEAADGRRWKEALRHAEQLLEICPEHEAAREVRRQAWLAAGIELRTSISRDSDCGGGVSPPRESAERRRNGRQAGRLHHKDAQAGRLHHKNAQARRLRYEASAMDDSTNAFLGSTEKPRQDAPGNARPSDRFLLWVDGVGGYLACTRDEVVIGQPVLETEVDVPILGDLSRRHAKIRRDGEAYLIEPRRPVQLDGRTIDRRSGLADGMLIEMGNVRLRFRRPHPLSATARLDFISRHRTQPSADGVLLMAESCVLGPNAQSHVVCGDWSRELILYRQGDELYCRRGGQFQIDGQPVAENGSLTLKSHVSGEDFSFSIESLVD